jgi:hypothetical protein
MDFSGLPHESKMNEVDGYGVPVSAFGDGMQPEFFDIIGRMLAVSGKTEYLRDRLDNMPASETSGVRKVAQFLKRDDSGKVDRNAVVHSWWIAGAHGDADVFVGIRYKKRKFADGVLASVSMQDVPGSDRDQEYVEYTLDAMRKLLKRCVTTMNIGELAYAEVMLKWATHEIASTE